MKYHIVGSAYALMIMYHLFTSSLQAQNFTSNLENAACDRTPYIDDCWQFSSFALSNSTPISGTCSARSSALSNPAPNQYVLGTPGLSITSPSTITFDHKAVNLTSTPNLTVTAYNTITMVETVIMSSTTYSSTATINQTINFSLPSGIYRIRFKPSGTGGTSRVLIDNIDISNAVQVENQGNDCVFSPLPLNLISFSAIRDNDDAIINWETSDEINLSHFEIQRSFDGYRFNTISEIFAGRNIYTFQDSDALTSVQSLYYRLRSVDLDGRFELSPIIHLKNPKIFQSSIGIYPNPATETIYFTTPLQSGTLQIINGRGHVVFTQPIDSSATSINIHALPAGLYTVKFTSELDLITTKFIKI